MSMNALIGTIVIAVIALIDINKTDNLSRKKSFLKYKSDNHEHKE